MNVNEYMAGKNPNDKFRIYHHRDPDGFASAMVVLFGLERFGVPIDNVSFVSCDYISGTIGEAPPDVHIIMVDYSVQPYASMLEWTKGCRSFLWIDHHKSAILSLEAQHGEVPFDGLWRVGEAGCELAWEFFNPEAKFIPEIISCIGRRDVWDTEIIAIMSLHEFNAVFASEPRIKPSTQNSVVSFWRELLRDSGTAKNYIRQATETGGIVLRSEKVRNANMAETYCYDTVFEQDGRTYEIILLNGPSGSSQVFEAVYDRNRHHFMMSYTRVGREFVLSFYSDRDDVDVGKIAASIGGGGHKGAAGATVKQLPEGLVL